MPLDHHSSHSRQTTPLLPEQQEEQDIVNNQTRYYSGIQHQHNKRETQLEAMLVKQGKQICALYELNKSINEKLTWIQGQIKKQNKNKDIDLSPKVFSVSIFIFKTSYYI